MGLDTASIKFLCAARSAGVNFDRTATIGRQSFFPEATALQRVFSALGIQQDVENFLAENQFAEPFFRLLGSEEVVSLDYSSYEGAGIVHDMNLPIPAELRGRFSVVHDGGTLEHIFNVPQALKNCMEMVQVGGHFTQVNEANNFMGHGFWQFSPELMFRVFSPANGYEIEAVLLHEVVPGGAWCRVLDPDQVRRRVTLCNAVPTYIMTVARRVNDSEIFARPPQQSDYVAEWKGDSRHAPDAAPGDTRHAAHAPSPKWRRYLPRTVERVAKSIRREFFPPRGFNKPYFRPIAEEALLRGEWK